jgi:hypothetical protein
MDAAVQEDAPSPVYDAEIDTCKDTIRKKRPRVRPSLSLILRSLCCYTVFALVVALIVFISLAYIGHHTRLHTNSVAPETPVVQYVVDTHQILIQPELFTEEVEHTLLTLTSPALVAWTKQLYRRSDRSQYRSLTLPSTIHKFLYITLSGRLLSMLNMSEIQKDRLQNTEDDIFEDEFYELTEAITLCLHHMRSGTKLVTSTSAA